MKSCTWFIFLPTEDFYSFENYLISSDFIRFRKSDNYGVSFSSTSLNHNKFFMKNYHSKERSFLHNTVKFECFAILKKNYNFVVLDTF